MNKKPTTSEWIVVKKSNIHNKGVFASKNIPKGTFIIEYVGEKISKKESERRYAKSLKMHENNSSEGSVYIFELDKKWDIDGHVPWNTAQWINHSCEPNCEAVDWPSNSGEYKVGTWIKSLRDIKKGEELFYNYGYDMEDYEEHPCNCGSKKCVGYIVAEEFWPQLKQKLKRKNARLKRKKLRNKHKLNKDSSF